MDKIGNGEITMWDFERKIACWKEKIENKYTRTIKYVEELNLILAGKIIIKINII